MPGADPGAFDGCVTMKTLYLIACAAPQSERLYRLIPLLQDQWQVCVILTPSAVRFYDVEKIKKMTGYPVRSEYKRPEDPDVLPAADALLVFPATFNTINKWALGMSDTLALGLLCEMTGMKVPILAVPVVRKGKLADHPAFPRSLRMLRRYGVQILYDPELYPPRNEMPPETIIEALNKIFPR